MSSWILWACRGEKKVAVMWPITQVLSLERLANSVGNIEFQ